MQEKKIRVVEVTGDTTFAYERNLTGEPEELTPVRLLRSSDWVTDAAQLPDKLTAAQVADWLQLSITAIYEMCRDGEIPHARICRPGSKKGRGVLRFDKTELEKWWDQRRITV